MTTLHYTSRIAPAGIAEYDGSYLPSAGTNFVGSEINPGVGTSVVSGGVLEISRPASVVYGWDFGDITGRLDPTSTYQVDAIFDASTAVYTPPLSSFVGIVPIAQLAVADIANGGALVNIVFRQNAGVDEIYVSSGTFSVVILSGWSTGPAHISFIRNALAGIYTLVVNGLPVWSTLITNLDGVCASNIPGVSFALLDAATSIAGFRLDSINAFASHTVYSAAWNFLHDWQSVFQGSNALTRDFILTNRGPLVKDWGDMTPATKNDVAVRVNNVPVVVSDVNPHIGKITLAVPIPFMPPGSIDVKADYIWLASPVMEMTGLNADGQVLNKWDRNINGFHDNGAVDWTGWDTRLLTYIPYNRRGAPDISRFPMGIVLGPMDTPEPLLIGHRYMGFEKESSALLNSATTMVLNQNPANYLIPGFEQIPQGVSVAYEGTTPPVNDAWELVGADAGGVAIHDIVVNGNTIQDITYVVDDNQTGSYSANPPCTLYRHGTDLSFPSSVTVVSRYMVNSTTLDGVFSGVGFGIHDDKRLYLVGNLKVNDVEHVGLLVDARYPHLLASWQIGPKVKATILTPTTVSFPTASIPTSIVVGNRFQILAPQTQAGVYTVSHIVRHSDGNTTLTLTTAFPAAINKYGNKYPDALFETIWTGKPSTYRMTLVNRVNVDRFGVKQAAKKLVQLSMAGLTSTFVTEFDDVVTATPQPAETSLALFLGQGGQDTGAVFWGSLSYVAKSNASWSFIRYGVVPDDTAIRGHSKMATTDMSVLPEDQPDQSWFQTQAFGYSRLLGGELCIKSTSSNETLNTTFAYGRNEPFFTKDSNIDLTATFHVDSAVLGAGDAEIVLNDGTREARVATIAYYENVALDPYRQIVRMPAVSMAGLVKLSEQGWTKILDPVTGDAYNHESDLVIDQVLGQFVRYSKALPMANLIAPDSGDRVIEASIAVDAAYVPHATGATGIFMTADVGAAATDGVAVTLYMNGATPQVRLVQPNNFALVQAYTFDWTDGALHTYRVVESSGTVSLFVDETFMAPAVNIALFGAQGSGNHRSLFGVTDVGGAGKVIWRAASYAVLPHANVHRTLGVWLGGDKDDIDQWEIPRRDSSSAKNSDQVGPTIEDMDWRSSMQVRVQRTWTWGVTVFRPDQAPPPYYLGPPADFATENAVPAAGWINVEYRNLPYVPSNMGFVGFGSFDSRSITQQWWEDVNFRLFKPLTDDWKQPQHMVLNQFNVMTSGEPILDATLENVVINPIEVVKGQGFRWVTLKPTHIYARDIYKIVDGNRLYTQDEWTFDPLSQLITLNQLPAPEPNNSYVTFSGNPVAVTYYPGKPVTDTYLMAQPLLDSMTLLNEGTPPVPKSQQDPDTKLVFAGGIYQDPDLAPDPNTIYEALTVSPAALYENMKFMTVDNGGWNSLITIAGEGTLPVGLSGWSSNEGEFIYDNTGANTGVHVGQGVGAQVLDFKGREFSEHPISPKKEALEQGGGMPGKFFMASGGNYMGPVVDGTGKVIGQKPLGGTLGPGTVLLYPNARSGTVKAGTDAGAINRSTQWYMRLQEVLTDQVGHSTLLDDTLPAASDSTPPTLPPNYNPNPSGAVVGDGAALAIMVGGGDFSHLGPWGGMRALSASPTIPPPPLPVVDITQQSLLGGGSVSLTNGVHDPLKAFTLQGGNLLPQGAVFYITV